MAYLASFKVAIADTAPIIIKGLGDNIKSLKDINPYIVEVDSKISLLELAASENIDLVLIRPTFGGLLHPSEIRKVSINPDIKIFAILISSPDKSVLSLFDNYISVLDDYSEIRDKIISTLHIESEIIEEKENLSIREKEIISYVVKGLTNQEIADKLFISVHTVMTHRRNIARKLQIHSATGLTIYAIVNNIVDLSEISLQ